MPKIFFIIMMCIGGVMGLILLIENMVISGWYAYTFIWATPVYHLIIVTLFSGMLIWYGLKWFLHTDGDEESHEQF